jgi:hypothetical protein
VWCVCVCACVRACMRLWSPRLCDSPPVNVPVLSALSDVEVDAEQRDNELRVDPADEPLHHALLVLVVASHASQPRHVPQS